MIENLVLQDQLELTDGEPRLLDELQCHSCGVGDLRDEEILWVHQYSTPLKRGSRYRAYLDNDHCVRNGLF
jgi:hypothetical protein